MTPLIVDGENFVDIAPMLRSQFGYLELILNFYRLIIWIRASQVEENGMVFIIQHPKLQFYLKIENAEVVICRNNSKLKLNIRHFSRNDSSSVRVGVEWSPSQLLLIAVPADTYGNVVDKSILVSKSLETSPTYPTLDLARWIRKHTDVRPKKFATPVDVLMQIATYLKGIEDKIREHNCYDALFNITRRGNKIIDRKPKSEPELVPAIIAMFDDLLFKDDIDANHQPQTGSGEVDVLLTAPTKHDGIARIAIEFKLAHSLDLENGLLKQLPSYMEDKKTNLGIYCVLDFTNDKKRLDSQRFPNQEPVSISDYLSHLRMESGIGVQYDIKIVVIRCWKPTSASKK